MKKIILLAFCLFAFAAGASAQSPGGASGDVQCNQPPGGSFGNCSATTENVKGDPIFYGPNPWIDVRLYGYRAVSSFQVPAIPGCTATTTSGSSTVTISGTGCAAAFQNGDGVVIYGLSGQAGPGVTNPITSISAPTITPSGPATMTGTDYDVNESVGSTNYTYMVCAWDVPGGIATQPGTSIGPCASASIANGQASLGPQTTAITSISAVGQTYSYVMSSATPLGIGQSFEVTGASPTLFNGVYVVAAVADSQHFTANQLYDTRSDIPSVATTPGNLTYVNSNRIKISAATGSANGTKYIVYNGAAGVGVPICVTLPQSDKVTTTQYYLACEDYGQTSNGSPQMTLPYYVPSTAPSGGFNEGLQTTIASGGGTSTLTLAAPAANNCTGCTILIDEGIVIANAAAAARTAGAKLYIPGAPGTGFAFTNAPTVLANGSEIEYVGQNLILNDMIYSKGFMTLNGNYTPVGSTLQFGLNPVPTITIGRAWPGLFLVSSHLLQFIQFTENSSSQVAVLRMGYNAAGDAIPGSHLNRVQFAINNGQSMGYVNVGVESGIFLNETNFIGAQIGLGNMKTPGFWCACGYVRMENTFYSGKGTLYAPSPAGGKMTVNWTYSQANYQPFFGVFNAYGNNIGTALSITDTTFDTTFAPLVTNYGGTGGTNQISAFVDMASSGANLFTGSPTITVFGGGYTNEGAVTGFPYYSTITDLNYFTNGFNASKALETHYASMLVGPQDNIFNRGFTPPAPTSCTAGTGGSVPVGTHTYGYMLIYALGGAGVLSNNCSAVTTTGNQTVTVTIPPSALYGARCMWPIRDGNQLTLFCLPLAPSYTDSSSFTANAAPSSPNDGPFGCGLWAQNGQAGNPGMASCHSHSFSAAAYTQTQPLTQYDNCNRANGPIGQNWTIAQGGFNTSSNQCVATSNSAENNAYYSAAWAAPDQFSQFTYSGGTINALGVMTRVTGSGATTKGYLCAFQNGSTLWWGNFSGGGSYGNVGTASITAAAGDVIRLESAGAVHSCYYNGVLKGSWTDGSLAYGQPGIKSFVTSAIFDNWSGGTFHPMPLMDQEQDWTQPQHFLQPITFGVSAPSPGTLTGMYTSSSYPFTANGGINLSGATAQNLSVYNTSSSSTHTNISATNMVAATSAQHAYSFYWSASLAAVGSGCTGSTTVVVNAIFTDPNAAGSATVPLATVTLANSGNGTLGFVAQGIEHIVAKSGTAVQYSTSSYSSGTGCTTNPSYQIFPSLVQLW